MGVDEAICAKRGRLYETALVDVTVVGDGGGGDEHRSPSYPLLPHHDGPRPPNNCTFVTCIATSICHTASP